jgi:hypothetical protein
VPADEAALRVAFDGGLLEERNWCELKALVESSKGANAELARDLASLAVDGGTLIVGLDEKAPNDNPLHPVELRGLAERVEQVADMKVHPPLLVECSGVSATGGSSDGMGYLIVHVPASPLAPHQVDGVYYGRGDKTRRRLTDPEVERLFQRRSAWAAGIRNDLTDFVTKRLSAAAGVMPHLFVAARPVAAWPDMCRPIVGGADWMQNLSQLRESVRDDGGLRAALNRMFPNVGYEVGLAYMTHAAKTPHGARLTMREPQTPLGTREWDVDLDVDESGKIWFSAAVMGIPDRTFNSVQYTGLAIDGVAVSVLQVLIFAAKLSDEIGYASLWDFGVALTNTRGTRPVPTVSTARATTVGAFGGAYEADQYTETTRASIEELRRRPGVVLDRVIGLLVRATHSEGYIKPLTDAAIST